MWGVLLAAFCERGGEETTQCLELWAYPDTTLNLVVNRANREGELEYSFPCAPYQLIGVLDRQPFSTETQDGAIVVSVEEENVTACFTSNEGDVSWSYAVPIEPFAQALRQVAPEASRFLA